LARHVPIFLHRARDTMAARLADVLSGRVGGVDKFRRYMIMILLNLNLSSRPDPGSTHVWKEAWRQEPSGAPDQVRGDEVDDPKMAAAV
jgi:hypothetical protein